MLSCHSFVELEKEHSHGYSDIAARFADSQRHTWNNDTCNRQKAGTSHQCLEIQGFHRSKDEVPMPQGPTRAGHLSSSPHDDNYANLASFQARTLTPMQNTTPTPVSQNAFQRVQGALNVPVRPSPPSQQPDQRNSRPIGIETLLNPLKGENHVNAGSAPGSLSEKTTGPPSSTKSCVPALPLARPPPRRQLSQEPAHSQAQNCEREGGINPSSPQLAFQSDSPSTQDSAYGQVSHAEPTMAPPIAFSSQPRSSFPSSGPASTISQVAFDTEAQHKMITLDTENGLLQVPINVQTTSKVADEKRKRNATASHRFRQRRKEKDRGASEEISKLEQRVRETEEERDFYRRERGYFRDVATRTSSHAALLPRLLSPRQRRHISLGRPIGYSNSQSQDPESGGRNGGRDTELRTSANVPPQGALMPSELISSGNNHRPRGPFPPNHGLFDLSAL